MKKSLLFCVSVFLISSLSFANILRVGYNGIAFTGVDYGTIQQANDAATAGDTIQVYGSVSGGTISKKLTILGFGYNFDVHAGLQAIGTDAPSYISSIYFGAGSDGSIILGISAGGIYIGDVNGTHLAVSNITIDRCFSYVNFYNGAYYGASSNIKILSSVIWQIYMNGQQPTDYPITNLQVFNCYVSYVGLSNTATSAVFLNCVSPSPTVSGTALSLTNAGVLVRNCIFGYSNAAANINTIYENNFFTEAQPAVAPPGTNNWWGQTFANLFTRITQADDNASYYGYTAEFDENYFTLKSGSPAINGGFDGNNAPTDCGIFGGEVPYIYKLSGVPAVPAIYKLTAPTLNASSNPYNVTISVRSNN